MKLSSHVTIAETDSGAVLLDERAGRYWQLNDTGILVVRCLLAGGSVETAVALLRERFLHTDQEAATDVARLVTMLRQAELVTA
ncbi:lasso peptide biosynthesis PqqD family chaperone [Micromonospora sp. NPDC048835]|uniref:lasso peptide biosynthesis PqqD family chaperone n=1 Tax=Micromonospora sp. NPDC048835 TaxID=3155147 RepID=UPI0033D3B123